MTDDDLVRAVCPLIGQIGPRFYFVPETIARGEELGLDVFGFYFVGRGGVLGDVEAPVVASALGYFNPDVVAMMWEAARAKIAPRQAAREYLGCCAEFGRRYLAEVDGLEAYCAAAEEVNGAASRSVAALALYAGVAAEPLPEDLPGRAMQLTAILREYRGSVHLAAIVTAGLSPAVAHYLRRPDDWRLFGWSDEQVPAVTDIDRRRLSEVDATTDRLVSPAYGVLDDAGRSALLVGAQAMVTAIGDVGSTLPG